MSEQDPKKYRRRWFKREAIEWGLILGILLLLYVTGLHTEVAGRLQQALLWTGIIQADTNVPADEQEQASYDVSLISLEGKYRTLRDFEGKVIFMNIWATWCSPCIAEMPNIQRLYEEIGDSEEIAFVMISVDDSLEKAEQFIERKEFTFPVYLLTGQLPVVYNSTVIPTTYVIDKRGKIVTSKRGMANYHTGRFKSFITDLIRQEK